MLDTDYPYYPKCTSDKQAASECRKERRAARGHDFAALRLGVMGVLSAHIRAKTLFWLRHLFSSRD